ncbi:MAG: phosphoglycerate kinase [Kiloniellales bacterium]|nr:phosphoglycerate kinase [Kiloniellales bacterium]
MSRFKTIDQLAVTGRRILVRVDLNVPMADGRVTDATRIERIKPTLAALTGQGARVILLSHYGRPKGKRVPEMSLAALVEPLEAALGCPVAFAPDCVGPKAAEAVAALGDGEVLLLENLRFHAGEEANDPAFADALAALGELYVDDAFSAAHRAHASVEALARRLPAAAGRLMQDELEHLALALEAPARPVMAIVGGAKVSTKLDLLGNLIRRMDLLVVGGGMANTFLHALGVAVGASLCERDMAATARDIVAAAKQAGCDIVLPTDAEVADRLAEGVASDTLSVKAIPEDRMILDVGPATSAHIARRLADCRTLVWNGPLGCFEVPPFDRATNQVARAAAKLTRDGSLLSVAGGGDTVAALAHAGVAADFSYVSTAGGAFLEWLEGKTLPGVAALEAAAG